jgi:hypothetical protein
MSVTAARNETPKILSCTAVVINVVMYDIVQST